MTPLKVLIVTFPGDTHANAVAWALRARGHRPVLWAVTDFPDYQQVTGRVDPEGRCSVMLRDGDHEIELCDADVVWLRRYRKPFAPEQAHPADRQVIEEEGDIFLRGLIEMLPQDAFWINPRPGATRANFKPVQLAAAAQVGLKVPETYFSNDPKAVRDFHDRCRQEDLDIILKTFRQQHWSATHTSLILPTTIVREEIFRDESSIAWCPAIYQPQLHKQFEVRATVMGDEILSLRLNSQERNETAQDWRIMHKHPISVAALELPADIREKSLALMRRLGIVFGCIDFVVTPAGEYIFLEVNEMGQFLWVEAECPAMPMLAAFTEFITSRDPRFKLGDRRVDDLALAKYSADKEWGAAVREEQKRHKKLAAAPRVAEA